jgi:hypothetical protein
MDQNLLQRFEIYFRHPDPDHDVLMVEDRAVACKNAKMALTWLGVARVFGGDPELFDDQLAEAVTRFQQEVRHRNVDGRIGPGTREKLVMSLLRGDRGASQFAKLDRSEITRMPTVFLSYAWADRIPVDKLDQWLRDHGVNVIRDINDFEAGSNIKDNIWASVHLADKVIAVYSKRSRNRDWPNFEHQISEQVELQIGAPVLIYLRLDETPLKKHDPHRIAIPASGSTLKEVGQAILKALNLPFERARYEYNEDEPL